MTIGKWMQPACSTAVQQLKPSVTTLLPAAKSRLASVSISFLRKPLTTVSRSRRGLRSADAQRYLASFAWRFNRRYQLDSLTERLAYACARTAPHPYRVIIAG